MKKPVPPKDYIDAVDVPTTVELQAIGIVRSDYRERHGTPRQSTVGEQKRSRIELFTERVPPAALQGLAAHMSCKAAVLAAVVVAAPPSFDGAFPFLAAILRSYAAQRLQHAEARTRGDKAEAKEVALRAETAPSAALRGAISDAAAVGVDGAALARARSRLDEIDTARQARRAASPAPGCRSCAARALALPGSERPRPTGHRISPWPSPYR